MVGTSNRAQPKIQWWQGWPYIQVHYSHNKYFPFTTSKTIFIIFFFDVCVLACYYFICKWLILHHSYSRNQFLFDACFALLELFRTYNVETFASQLFFLLKTFILCNLISFDNVNNKSVQPYIVKCTWYKFIPYSIDIYVYTCMI